MFNINGEEWYIEIVSPDYWMLRRSNGSLALGACDDISKTIYITGDIDDKLFRKVLCHEITHAAMFSYDVSLSIDQEELLADLISTYGDEIIYITNKIFNKIRGGY